MRGRRSRTVFRTKSMRRPKTLEVRGEKPMDVQTIVQQAIDEYMRKDTARREPAYKTELQEERRRREQLEKRMNELVEENKRSRAMAEETQRNATIRTELQKLGVKKIDLAYKAVQ